MMEIKIAPSILAADFGRLAEEVRAAERGGASMIHVDVMDGRFVPEITMGPVVVRAVREATRLPLDVHLMIVEPDRHLEAFAHAGASRLAVHVEATPHLYQTVRQIAALGVSPGVALNPATPLEQIAWALPWVEAVIVMTVEPGAGGQAFIPELLPKIRELAGHRRGGRRLRRDRARGRDGGVRGTGGPGGRDRPAARGGDGPVPPPLSACPGHLARPDSRGERAASPQVCRSWHANRPPAS